MDNTINNNTAIKANKAFPLKIFEKQDTLSITDDPVDLLNEIKHLKRESIAKDIKIADLENQVCKMREQNKDLIEITEAACEVATETLGENDDLKDKNKRLKKVARKVHSENNLLKKIYGRNNGGGINTGRRGIEGYKLMTYHLQKGKTYMTLSELEEFLRYNISENLRLAEDIKNVKNSVAYVMKWLANPKHYREFGLEVEILNYSRFNSHSSIKKKINILVFKAVGKIPFLGEFRNSNSLKDLLKRDIHPSFRNHFDGSLNESRWKEKPAPKVNSFRERRRLQLSG